MGFNSGFKGLILSSDLGIHWKFPDHYSIGLCTLSSLLHAESFSFFFILNNLKMCKTWSKTYKLYSVYSEEDSNRFLRKVVTLTKLHGVLPQYITISIFTTVLHRPTQNVKVANNKILYFNVIFSDMFRLLRHYQGEIRKNTNGLHINITIHIHKLFFIFPAAAHSWFLRPDMFRLSTVAIIKGYNIIQVNEWSFCAQRLRIE